MLKIKDYLLRNKDVLRIKEIASAVGINEVSTMPTKLKPAGTFNEDESFKIRKLLKKEGITTQRKRVSGQNLKKMRFIKIKPLVERTNFSEEETKEIWQRIYDGRSLDQHSSLSGDEIEKALGEAIKEVAEGL